MKRLEELKIQNKAPEVKNGKSKLYNYIYNINYFKQNKCLFILIFLLKNNLI